MQKIPTVFLRDKENPKRVTKEVDPECQWVLDGEGVATEKFDGSACAIIEGKLYKRHQHKAEKGDPPDGWIHWTHDPEQRSGHGWLPCIEGDPSSRYHLEAFTIERDAYRDGTYELVGKKSNGNPYRMASHHLWRHGSTRCTVPDRSFDGLRDWLSAAIPMEGLVFHHPDGRIAKIKRRDFGLPWPS